MAWATFADVEDRWVGPGLPTDENLVNALLADAQAVVLSEFPAIQDRIEAGTLPQGVLTMVQVRMVSRVLRNPENLTYWQQNTGPFGQGKNYGSGNTDIWLTDEERNLLAPKRSKGKAYEIDLAPNAVPGSVVVLMNGDDYKATTDEYFFED
jgi:hypothetical protein